jgi:8-oxo-dGTP pyrophosphatase MutT (NUDIX family)
MILPWKTVESRPSGDYRVFTVRTVTRVSPRTGAVHDFFVLDSPGWVNVIALTQRDELVMVEQYRHGTETVELEIPGGVMDPHDATPLEAGVRELREETGYEGRDARILGQIAPNPAIMSNTCYTVLVRDCEPRHPVQLDGGEDVITRLVPWREIDGLVASGRIRHALVVVALYHFRLWRGGSSPA